MQNKNKQMKNKSTFPVREPGILEHWIGTEKLMFENLQKVARLRIIRRQVLRRLKNKLFKTSFQLQESSERLLRYWQLREMFYKVSKNE